MEKLVRVGDTSDHGGVMISASGRFDIDGREGCVDGDRHQCPIQGHGTTPVRSSTVNNADGKGILRTGDVAGCGARIITGTDNVLAE